MAWGDGHLTIIVGTGYLSTNMARMAGHLIIFQMPGVCPGRGVLASGIYSKIQDQTANKLNPTGQGGGGGGGSRKCPR